MAKPIKRVSLQSEIIKYIQSYIEEHDLKEGDRLPSQGQFIEMMQVSRTALREAVKDSGGGRHCGSEERQRHICRMPRKESNGTGVFDRFTMERESLIEALEARRAMETELMAMVVRNATDQEMDELGEITEVL